MDRPWNIFFWLGLIGGLAMAIGVPPFHVPDEPAHFYRSFQVSQGALLAEKRGPVTGGILPRSLRLAAEAFTEGIKFNPGKKISLERIKGDACIELAMDRSEFIAFSNTALYSPLPYLPQAFAMRWGTRVDLSPVWLVYLGRISNLLCALVIISLAIRITPLYRWLFFLTALSPMALHLMASLSADALTNALSLLVAALM